MCETASLLRLSKAKFKTKVKSATHVRRGPDNEGNTKPSGRAANSHTNPLPPPEAKTVREQFRESATLPLCGKADFQHKRVGSVLAYEVTINPPTPDVARKQPNP